MATGKGKANTSTCFPDGLRVLLVDNDLNSLQELTSMCQRCGYKVTLATSTSDALPMLRENRSNFDIVISDINIRDKDAFEFVEIIALKMNLPIVLTIADVDNDVLMRGISSGASDYLLKPVQMDSIKFIWKHVIQKQKHKALEQAKMKIDVENCRIKLSLKGNIVNAIDEENRSVGSSDRTEMDEGNQNNDTPRKKQRMVWTSKLHQQFVDIVNQIGVKNAVPKKILEMMNVVGLTRENVASHLQKYRMYIRRMEESTQQKVQTQTQAINHGINAQMYSSNGQDPVNSGQAMLQLLGQKRSCCAPPLNQISVGNCKEPESRLGLQIGSSVKQEMYPRIFTGVGLPSLVDEFSHFKTIDHRNLDSSSSMERPLKIQKMLSGEVSNEVLADDIWEAAATFSSVDDSTRLTSQFGELELSFQNSGDLYYDDSRIINNTSDLSSEPMLFAQNFDHETETYSQQLDGKIDGYHPSNNSI